MVPAPAHRRRTLAERRQLAMGCWHRNRRIAVLPHLQSNYAEPEVRPGRRLHPRVGAGALRAIEQTDPRAVGSAAARSRCGGRHSRRHVPRTDRRPCLCEGPNASRLQAGIRQTVNGRVSSPRCEPPGRETRVVRKRHGRQEGRTADVSSPQGEKLE